MFCLHYDILIKILKFLNNEKQKKLQESKSVILSEIDKFKNDLKTYLNFHKINSLKTY
mgnify:CR=1 FL=1